MLRAKQFAISVLMPITLLLALGGCPVPLYSPVCKMGQLGIGAIEPVIATGDARDWPLIFGRIRFDNPAAQGPISINLIHVEKNTDADITPQAIDRGLSLDSEGRFLWAVPAGDYVIHPINFYSVDRVKDSFSKQEISTPVKFTVQNSSSPNYLGTLVIKLTKAHQYHSAHAVNELAVEQSLLLKLGHKPENPIQMSLMEPDLSITQMVVKERSICSPDWEVCLATPWGWAGACRLFDRLRQ